MIGNSGDEIAASYPHKVGRAALGTFDHCR